LRCSSDAAQWTIDKGQWTIDKGQWTVKDGAIQTKSFAFAVRVVNLCKHLCNERKEFVLSKQLLRSGTAIGALVREAEQAESRPDFVHKMAIALKEANETEYWILLLRETGYLNANGAESVLSDSKELLKLLTRIINSTKQRMAQ
jgi:four helix bundle protein